MKPRHRRDYSYAEWRELTPQVRRSLIEEYWDPREPELGEATRASLLEGFGAAHPHLLTGVAEARTAYFTNWGWCIAVIVTDPSVRVPTQFDEFRVVKGVTDTPEDPLKSISWLSR